MENSQPPPLANRRRDGKTALHLAASTNNLVICQTLIQKNHDVNARDWSGITPFEEAEFRGFNDCFELLRKNGTPRTWNAGDLNCPICLNCFWKPLTLTCGHSFCRSCLQLSRKGHNECPVCRDPIILADGYTHNSILKKLLRKNFPEDYRRTAIEQFRNPVENALANMKELSESLGFPVSFNEKHSTVLKYSDVSLHISYLIEKKQIFLYSPLMTGLPADSDVIVQIYETLLQSTLDSNSMGGGGLGIIVEKEMIVYHMILDMEEAPAWTLRTATPGFLEKVRAWKKTIIELIEASQRKKEVSQVPYSRKRKHTDHSSSNHAKRKKRAAPAAANATTENIKANILQLAETFNLTLTLPEDVPDEIEVGPYTIKYEEEYERITICAPMTNFSNGVPRCVRRKMYEKLLSASTFGSGLMGGGVGLRAASNGTYELVMFASIKLSTFNNNNNALAAFATTFTNTLNTWKEVTSGIAAPCFTSCSLAEHASAPDPGIASATTPATPV